MGETGREAVHSANTYVSCAMCWGHCGEPDSKVPTIGSSQFKSKTDIK